MLTPRGYRVSKDTTAARDIAALKKELTMTPLNMMASFSGQQVAPSFPIYQETLQALYVPKYFGLQRFGVPARNSLDVGMPCPRLLFTGALRPEQQEPCKAFMAAAADPTRMGGIISLSCGQGKTVIALSIMAQLKVRTMIIVHKDFLLDQWTERIHEFLPGASVGLVKAKTVDVADKDVIIASVQSLSMKEYDAAIYSGVGLLVVDECHRVGTEVFSRALMKNTFRWTLGLSATVQRKDGMTKAFVGFLGDVVFKGQRRQDVVSIAQVRYFDDNPAYSREELIGSIGKPNTSRMINNICGWSPRNRAIVNMIASAITRNPERKVLVLSDRKEQLESMRRLLAMECISSGFYYGGLKKEVLAESEKQQVLLATYAYAAEGMDCKALNTLVLASPKSDIEQSCGRILRERAHERTVSPLIIDIVDGFSSFERQGAKRRAYYRKNKYSVYTSLDAALDPTPTNLTQGLEVEHELVDSKDDSYAFRSFTKVPRNQNQGHSFS